MKPAWDELMTEWENSPIAVVADVDCTAAGEKLCNDVGVRGYPTIKYGDPNDLQDYNGGRDLDSLKKFASENLGPVCSPANIDACAADTQAQMKKFVKFDIDELDEQITELEKKVKAEEAKYEQKEQDAQKMLKKAKVAKDKAIKKIKDSGLASMKTIKAYKESTGKSEL
jgi:hypothetical protein